MKSTEILTLRNYVANISNFNDDYLAYGTLVEGHVTKDN